MIKRLMIFLIQLKKAKKFVGKKWRIILPVLKFFTNDFLLPTKFYANLFSCDKVSHCASRY